MKNLTKIFKIKYLFWILFILGLAKFFLILFLLGFHTYNLEAKEKSFNKTGCPPEFSEILILEKKSLYEKEKKMETKEKELKLLQRRIQEQMMALKELEASIDEKLKKLQMIQDKKVKLLVKAVAEMRPSKAANVLLNMDREMAVKILSQLKSTQVANILSAMPPDKAAALSEALSGYPPKEY
ncbi:MotE family protein [Thermodesulfobacterium hydrogeniphilum]|uniref:MotE family protein n=1 Tax=Thermodesulfobacterium hydrogeniphilum TaxID=161156 RepID=UPI00057041BF|nr:hypothetical protein [Thermodesulfobacterium hydrogeniphilum]